MAPFQSSSIWYWRRFSSPGDATTSRADVLIVGAGASGLAVAAELSRRGVTPTLLDQDREVGGTWAGRYERLHLHTVRRYSGLPHYPLPRSLPRYVPTADYARYLDQYARRFGLDVRLRQKVRRVRRDGGEWIVDTNDTQWRAPAVVIAMGRHNEPRLPAWPGVSDFRGKLLHSHEYKSGRAFAGRRALVVGIGNSGAEIAADLVECGASSVAIAVRTPPPITSREIAGIPVQLFGIALAGLPPRFVDRLGVLLRRVGTGDLTKYGLGAEQWGPFTARRPPVIDVGFLGHLRAGRIQVRPDVARFVPEGVMFSDGIQLDCDVVVAATGYTTGLPAILAGIDALDERGYPRLDASHSDLWFAGYSESPRGQLYESNRAARGIARAIAGALRESRGKLPESE
ncbi:MAG: flavin-containing monooxygenase [Gemmatimonadaceae bacterium]